MAEAGRESRELLSVQMLFCCSARSAEEMKNKGEQQFQDMVEAGRERGEQLSVLMLFCCSARTVEEMKNKGERQFQEMVEAGRERGEQELRSKVQEGRDFAERNLTERIEVTILFLRLCVNIGLYKKYHVVFQV